MLDETVVNQVEAFLEKRKLSPIKGLLPNHPEDIANLITRLELPSSKLLLFRLVHHDKVIDVFEYLSSEEEGKISASLSSIKIKGLLNGTAKRGHFYFAKKETFLLCLDNTPNHNT